MAKRQTKKPQKLVDIEVELEELGSKNQPQEEGPGPIDPLEELSEEVTKLRKIIHDFEKLPTAKRIAVAMKNTLGK